MTNTEATTTSAAARSAQMSDILRVVTPASPATGSDGETVFVRQSVDASADANVSELWIIGAEETSARRLTSGPSDSAPSWTPSGEVLFLRDVDGAAQAFTIDPRGGDACQLTFAPTFPLGVTSATPSPLGTHTAVTAFVDQRAASDDIYVATSLRHKVDGMGLRGSLRSHVFHVEHSSGAVSQLTDGDWDAAGVAYSPDGMSIAFAGGIDASAPLEFTSRVHILDLSLPTFPVRTVGTSTALYAPLLWTPTGSEIVAVGSAAPGLHHNHLMVIDVAGSAPDRSLTAGLDRNVMPGGPGYPGGRPALSPDAQDIVFCLRDGGSTHVWAAPLDGTAPRPILTGAQSVVSGLSVGVTTIRAILATATSFGELVEIPLSGGEPQVLTDFGATLDDVSFPVATSRRFTISDGTEVEAFILRDAELSTAGPLVLDVHGGPHNAWTGVPSIMQPHHADLVALGYTVLMINPRGSDGYGESFFTAVHDAWGEADVPDLMEPIAQLVAEGIADPAQLVVTGYSYGGFMTAALTSQSGTFAAAVAGGLVCDLAHLAGASDDGVMLERFEFAPGSGNARRLSPLENVDNVTTPTLVLHGGADVLCPAVQAEQWHAGLTLAGVETELVLYPGGAHAFVLNGKPSHRLDYSRRLVAWFERHLSPLPARATVDAAFWQRKLERLITQFQIPGAQLGILTTTRSGVEVTTVSAGVLNTITAAPVQPDSLFQIGSITKVWTGVLIMQLVEEGLLDLDAPIRAVLPEFAVADEHVSATVTARQLLTHASGIDGDVFIDTGRGDDNVARYVAAIRDVVQNFAPGEDWSYCNTAFGILGRVVEVLRGEIWDDALRQRIIEPLGLTHTVTLPDDTLRYSSAVGHGAGKPVPHVLIARSAGPAGLISARVEDVLRFAADSISPNPVLLSRAGHDAMLEDQQVAGCEGVADVQGLAWLQHDWDGTRVHGHNGGTLGQQAFMRISRETGVGVALFTNGGMMGLAGEEIFHSVLGMYAGIGVPAPFSSLTGAAAAITEEDATTLVGHYGDAQAQIDVTWDGATLLARRVDVYNPSGRGEETEEVTFTITRGPDGYFAAGIAGFPSYARVWRRDHSAGTVLHFGSRAFRQAVDA